MARGDGLRGAAAAGFDRFFFPVFLGTQIKATSSSPSGVTVFVRGARIAGGGGRAPGPLTGTQTSGTSSSSIVCYKFWRTAGR